MNKWTIRLRENSWHIYDPKNICHERVDRRSLETETQYTARAYRIAWAHAATTNIFNWADR